MTWARSMAEGGCFLIWIFLSIKVLSKSCNCNIADPALLISSGHVNVVCFAWFYWHNVSLKCHHSSLNSSRVSLMEYPSTASWKWPSDHPRNILCTESWHCLYSDNDFWLQICHKKHKSSDKLKMFSAIKAVRKCRCVQCSKCQDPQQKWSVQCRERYQRASSWFSIYINKLSRVLEKN
jgi:hypothetical protein